MPVSGSIFSDPTAKIPKSDSQIVRVDMEQNDIGGRKDNLPTQTPRSDDMSIKHVPSQG